MTLTSAPPRQQARPVLAWAALGGLAVLVASWGWVGWVASGQAEPVGTGPDPVPDHVRAAVIAFQVLSTASAVTAVAYVVRQCRQQHRLTLDAMLLIGWSLAWWHDPIINWLRPTVFYNAYAVNLGSWTDQLPGWYSPGGETMAEPLLVIGTVYVWMPLLCARIADAAMTRARERAPGWGALRVFLAGWAAVAAYELVMEVVAVRLELVGYPSSIAGLTLWAGESHQLPVYACLLWSLTLTVPGALRHSRDASGRTVVERGADRVRDVRLSTALRLLAVVGFVNLVAVGYDVAMVVTSVHADRVELYPSYLRTGQCGPGTDVACPGPGVPLVPRR